MHNSISHYCCFHLISCVWLFVTMWTAARQAWLSPGVCSDSCPLSWWCYLTIREINHHPFSSVQFIWSVVSSSLWHHEPQHIRPPCPSPAPRVHPKPCPSSLSCHPTISSSVVPFSSCPHSFPGSGSFQMSQLFASKYWSFSLSISPSN